MQLRNVVIVLMLCTILLIGCTKQNQNDARNSNKNSKENIISALVVGVDSRGEKHSRADSILYVQYVPKEEKMKIVSFMRDSYVDIPGHKWNKINQAYYYGGMPLLKKTLQHNFGITFDHYAVFDFESFNKIVDSIAPNGITVELSNEMIEDMALPYGAGKVTLHGEELLKFARFRHDEQSDFGRVERQQFVLKSIANELTKKLHSLTGINDLYTIWKDGWKYIDTDLTKSKALTYAAMTVIHPISSVDTMRIPANKTYINNTYDNAGMVLELDFEENMNVLMQFLQPTLPVSK